MLHVVLGKDQSATIISQLLNLNQSTSTALTCQEMYSRPLRRSCGICYQEMDSGYIGSAHLVWFWGDWRLVKKLGLFVMFLEPFPDGTCDLERYIVPFAMREST